MAATSVGKRGPGRPRKTDEDRAAERAAILASARAAIARRGPDISLDEIAAAAAVSKPTLYAHFADKAGLANALAVELAQDLDARTESIIRSAGVADPIVLLREGIDTFTLFMTEDTNLYRFVVRSIRTGDSDVVDNALVLALRASTSTRLRQVFPDMDEAAAEVAAYAVLGQVFAACEGWLQHRRFTREALVDMLVRLFVGGVVGLAG